MQLLQIVGEAARRLSDRARTENPDVPWGRIVALRNRLIHGYDTVDLDRLWPILTQDLPKLAAALKRMIGPGTP